MRLFNQVVAALFIAIGLFIIWQAQRYQMFTDTNGAGPGFLPTLTGGGMVIVALVILINSSRHEPKELAPGVLPERSGILRVGALVASLGFVIVGIEDLGYRLAMFAYLLFVMLLLSKQKWFVTIGVALGGSVGVFWLFVDQLNVMLPTGMFGF